MFECERFMKNGVFCPENPDADGDGEVLSGDSAEG